MGMNTRVRVREDLILACCIWAFQALLEMVIAKTFVAMAFIWAAHGLVLMLIMGFLLKRVLASPSWGVRWFACIALALIFTLLQTTVDMATTLTIGKTLLQGLSSPPGMTLDVNNLEFQLGFKLTFKYYIWLFGFYTVTLALLQAVRVAYQARLEAQRADLDALRLEVNPHFLFNALNSVSALILEGRHRDAETMTLSLARFYRDNLTAEGVRMARVDAELDALDAYVELEQVRLGDRLQLEVDCPPELMTARLPSLLLQPVVENAIKHGAAEAGRPVRLTVRRLESRLEIIVENKAPEEARSVDGTGTGLSNVRRRLSAVFGDRVVFESRSSQGLWRVRLVMPLTWDAEAGPAES